MEFRELSLSDCEQVRAWRNEQLHTLRTPYALTKEMQEDFYKNTVCNRLANSRWWGIWKDDMVSPTFIGMCGLLNIEWENRCAEISILLKPISQRCGHGTKAVEMLLYKGFKQLNLENIYGECYTCNPAIEFWKRIADTYNAVRVYLPNRKCWGGDYHHSLYFNINKYDFGGK